MGGLGFRSVSPARKKGFSCIGPRPTAALKHLKPNASIADVGLKREPFISVRNDGLGVGEWVAKPVPPRLEGSMSTYECVCPAAGETSFAAAFHENDDASTTMLRKPGAAAQIIAAVISGIARWYRFRRAIAELRRMDGRMLRDIGVEPDQIVSVVHAMTARDAQRWPRD